MHKEIVVGHISGVYGIRGWVKVRSFTTPPDNILRYSPWGLRLPKGEEPLPVTVAEGRRYKNGCLVRLDACQDPDHALELVGADIVIDREQLPTPGEEEYYWTDLIGCRVLTRDGADLGRVDKLIETGANDVLVVKGDREYLIPFVPGRFILSVDLVNRVIRADWDTEI
uniref:Ribosome maturation factor RimM n=1 Tax=Candidatus Kentrum sp. DK TaxID=2126562 RepID=A0A450S9N9_9GAMM|nr:MAG: 16S rRNA processing protein RimM [Candidatus Kentron sp. DK]